MCEECEMYKAEFAREAAVFEAAHNADVVLSKTIPLPEDHFLLRAWGKAATYPEFRAKYGKPNECDRVYAWWFTNQEALDAFKQELTAFCQTLINNTLVYDAEHRYPNLVKHRTVAYVTLSYKGKEYEVKKDYGYGYPAETAIFDWEENNTSCDCNRLPMLERTHPGTVAPEAIENPECVTTAFVTAFRIAYEQ